MRFVLLLAFALAASPLLAQSRERLPSPPVDNGARLPAPSLDSVGEIQARSRLETDGYSNVSTLIRDSTGVWRGKADRGGSTFDVAVDANGNVTAQ